LKTSPKHVFLLSAMGLCGGSPKRPGFGSNATAG